MSTENPPSIEQIQLSERAWRSAIQQCLQGTPVHLMDYLTGAPVIDGHGRPLKLYALPESRELRWEIVSALLHIGRFSDRLRPDDFFVREHIGTPRERVRALEVGAAALFKDAGASKDDMHKIAESLGIEAETLERRIRDQRKEQRKPEAD